MQKTTTTTSTDYAFIAQQDVDKETSCICRYVRPVTCFALHAIHISYHHPTMGREGAPGGQGKAETGTLARVVTRKHLAPFPTITREEHMHAMHVRDER